MFPPPRAPSPRQRSASCSIDDDHSSTKDRPRRLFHRHYVHDLSTSSQSLATTNSHHDVPSPSVPTRASHISTHSTPMTSPSIGHSSPFPGSLSSATSESVPSAESKFRSDFGILIPGPSSAYSPIHGSASSRSSHPVSPWSRSTTESDPQASAPRIDKRPSGYFSHRPLTAPHSPLVFATAGSTDTSPADHHMRSHSRLTESIKNIFSRNTVPSPSRFSFNSATITPQDNDASSSSFRVPASAGKWTMTPRKSRPPDLEISGSVAPALPSPARGSNTSIDAHRRYASEATPKIYDARMGSGPPPSQENLGISLRNVPPTRAREPKTRNVLRRRPSGSSKLSKARERGMGSPSRSNEADPNSLRLPIKEDVSRQGGIPLPLTPAGAVAEAYKQQELHRDDTPSPSKLSIDDRMSPSASHDGGYDQDHPKPLPTPYYTVFGSSSERRAQPGSPDDRSGWLEADQRISTTSRAIPSHQPSMSDPGGHGITRKLSTRWRKIKGEGVVTEESPLRDKWHSKARPSLQEIWGVDKTSLRATGQSMDGVPDAGDGARASPIPGHAQSGPEKGEKSEGTKLWRLVRQISTGGLRDRFLPGKAVPPVPTIPKELLQKANQGERDNEPLSRHQLSSCSPDKDYIRAPTAPKHMAVARPSLATSSSPNSSDVASTQFFRKTHSARSSISSYGEAVVVSRTPESVLDRHIIAPLEQLRLGDDHVENDEPSTSSLPSQRSPRRSTSVPAGLRTVEDAEVDDVPLPSPSRQTLSWELPSAGPSRPSSTPTSAPGSARASYQSPGVVLGQSRMVDGIVSLSPPPRPSKNPGRGGGGNVASSPSHPMVVKQVDAAVGTVRQMGRTPSGQSDMTARLESPEPGRSQGRDRDRDRDRDASPHTRTRLTFRKLDAPRRPPLTEREKADIWNDLLAQSDKAGGTLHIKGTAELMSDSMRLSTHSEV